MSTTPSQRPVRLLSLDGGGVRGLSEIMILKHLMDAVNDRRDDDEELHPWQVFDMIGGTSTGGIIAIMLGRLRMSLDDCETAYLALTKKIFTPKRQKGNLFKQGKDFLNADGKFDSKVLEEEIVKLLKNLPDSDQDTLLKDLEPRCRVFVVTTRENNSEPAILRSYKNPKAVQVLYDECKVWEACRATSAAPTFFDPIRIGKYGQVFADGGMLYNNPVQLIHREASNIWPDRGALLISIGTGSAPGKSLKGDLKTVIDRMKEIVTETEKTANDFFHDHDDMVKNDLLYRFTVTNGLANIGLEEYKEVGAMADATQTYLSNGEISKKVESCANILAEERQPIALQSTSEQQDEELVQQRIIEWLSPLNFFKTQIDVSQKRQDGTGQWLLDSGKFKTWVSNPGDILWCWGMPGAGKTVLASLIVDHLQQMYSTDQSIGIAFIYFDYKEEAIQTTLNLLSSLLKQLLQNRVELCSDLKSFYGRHWRQDTQPSLSEISKVLQNVLTSHDRVFVVIDALDECPEKDGIRATFLRYLKDLVKNMSMVILSRRNVHIDQEFERVTPLEIRATDEDIVTYLEDRIQDNMALQRNIKKDPHLKSRIIETITEKSQGMFLLARLHMDSMMNPATLNEIYKALSSLPIKSDDIYAEAMKRIENQNEGDRNWAKKILCWLSFAFKQLSVVELQHALAVSPGASCLDTGDLPNEEFMVSVCAGLVTFDQHSNIIRLVHYSTQEYFNKFRNLWFPMGQIVITRICLTYLSFDVFKNGYCSNDEEMNIRLKESPFLRYAAQHWGSHAVGEPERELMSQILAFLAEELRLSCSVQAMCLSEWRYFNYSQDTPRNTTRLWVAAVFGLEIIARSLIEQNVDLDMKISNGNTALHEAAERGHEAVVKLLLEKGADVVAKDYNGETALHVAASNGHEAMVNLLLEKKADVAAKDNIGRTALHEAAWGGHEAVVKLLLERGADAAAKDNDGETALHAAAWIGHEAVVKLLLEKGANVAAKDNLGRTALYVAAERGHEAVVKLLLEKGADVAANDNDGETALYVAAQRGHEAVVKLLLERGADAAAKDNDGETALHAAAWIGHEAVVKLLLEKGANVAAKDNDGQTALPAAASNGHEAVVKLLLEKGADVAANDNRGRTALYVAAERGHEAVVKLLLEKGADVAAKSDGGPTALHWAARSGHEAVAKLLLEKGADIAVKDERGGTALHWAAGAGHEAVVKLLLEKGANVAAKDNDGQTALPAAASNGHEAVVKLLLEKGADVAAKSDGGPTALHWAASNGHEAVVKLLLERGAVVVAKDNIGQTALHAAASNGHEAVVKLLLEKGADVAAKSDGGPTALHWAARSGHEAVAKLLLEKGADIATKDEWGGTALYWAAGAGHEAVVKLLLEKGADIATKDERGGTALHWAAGAGHEAVVKLLLEKGANVAAKDNDGQTALPAAASNGHEAVVKLLLEKGADVAAKSDGGPTALHWAASNGHEAVVKLLLERGAVVVAKDNIGQTALHAAAWSGHEAMVKLLLEKGADVAVKDNDGRTALYGAAWRGHEVVVKLLLEKGADATTEDNDGLTALDGAVQEGHEAVVMLLQSFIRP